MAKAPLSHAQVLQRWLNDRALSALARRLSERAGALVTHLAVRQWLKNSSIPERWRPHVAAQAIEDGYPGITVESLDAAAAIHREKQREARDLQKAARHAARKAHQPPAGA